MSNTEVGAALNKALSSSDGLHALIGDRIYPQLREQNGKTPALIYSFEGQGPPLAKTCGLVYRRQAWQIVCYAKSYTTLEEMEALIGETLGEYVSSVLREVVVLGGSDDYEDETNLHARVIDLNIAAWSRG